MNVLLDLSLSVYPHIGMSQDMRMLSKALAADPAIRVTGLIYSRHRRSLGHSLYWGKRMDQRLLAQTRLLRSMVCEDPETGFLKKAVCAVREFRRMRLKHTFRLQPLLNDQLFDWIWRNYLQLSFQPEDYAIWKKMDYVLSDITADAYLDRLHARRVEPRLITRGYDAVVFPTVTPLNVSPGTRKIMQHDAGILLKSPDVLQDAASEIRSVVSPCYFPDSNPARLKQILLRRSFRFSGTDRAVAAIVQTGVRYFLTVFAGEPCQKDPRILEAFEALAETEKVCLVVVGSDGWSNTGIQHQMERLGGEGKLLWLQGIAPEEMRLVYSSALALVDASFSDECGCSGLEAMNCGTNILASNTATHREIYGSRAFYFDPQESDSMVKAMRRMFYGVNLEADALSKRKPNGPGLEIVTPRLGHKETGSQTSAAVYFLHIRKTAGTSVRILIENSFSDHEIFPGFYSYTSKSPSPPAKPYAFYRGHKGMEVLPYMPETTEVVIWLRDPARRLLSDFFFRKQEHQFPESMTLEEYLEMDDGHTLLRTIRGGPAVRGDLSHRELEKKRVMNFLESCRVVGLVEEQDVSVHLLCHRLGLLPPPVPPRLNVSTRSGYDKGLTAEQRELLRRHSEGDGEIYQCARDVFRRQVCEMDADLGLGEAPTCEARQTTLTRRFWERYQNPWREEIHYTFDQPLLGWGWLDREFESGEDGDCFRWIGPSPEAVIWLPLCRSRALHVSVRVHSSIIGEPAEVLRLSGGETQAVLRSSRPVRNRPGKTDLEWELPADPGFTTGKPTPLCFRVARLLRPMDIFQGSMDPRELGVSLSRIDVQSV